MKIVSFSLDAIVYTPIYAPKNAYRIEIINATDVKMTLRTTSSDPDTSLDVLPGEAKTLEVLKNTYPYDDRTPICYAILASSTGKVKVLAH